MTQEPTLRIPSRGCQSSSRRLRILQVVPTYYPAIRYGGPIRSVHGLAKALVDRGHEVHVFTSTVDGPHDLDVPRNRSINLDGVLVRYFRVPFLRRLYWSPSMQAAFRAEVSHFDVIHLHSVFLWPTWAAARVARCAGVPYFLSPRGSLGLTVIRRRSRIAKSLWIRLIEQANLRDSAAVHVTTDVEGEELRALGLELPRLCCVPNGVAAPPVYPGLKDGPFAALEEPYALFLSRINWKKGLDRLIKAWKWVPDLPLVIAGNDEEGYQPQLAALASSEGVLERVRFIGPVADEHKWALYRNAAMLVLPSYSENFGNVVAEAMTMECPVIVTKEVGLASLVRQSGAGIVVDGEPLLIAQAVNDLLRDEMKRKRCGLAGRRAAADSLSWDAVARQMSEEYRAAILARNS